MGGRFSIDRRTFRRVCQVRRAVDSAGILDVLAGMG